MKATTFRLVYDHAECRRSVSFLSAEDVAAGWTITDAVAASNVPGCTVLSTEVDAGVVNVLFSMDAAAREPWPDDVIQVNATVVPPHVGP